MLGTIRHLCAPLLSLGLAACASGDSNLERVARGIHAVDGAAALGALWLAYEYGQPWREHVEDHGAGRYRIVVGRAPWSGAGEGDFGRRFHNLGARTCARYRLVAYHERLEPVHLAGAARVAEGLIECSAP